MPKNSPPMQAREGLEAETGVRRRAYRVSEFCEAFRLSRSTVYELIAAGKLASIRVAGRRLIPADAAEALLTPTPKKAR